MTCWRKNCLGLDMSAFDFDWGLPEDQTEDVIGDEAPEVDEDAEPITKLGDIWQLGRWVYCKKCGKKHFIR